MTKKTITFLLVMLLLVSPVAYAFSFSDVGDFFKKIFGPADITGMAKGKGDPCGDGICNTKIGENCATCAKDCACNKGYSCSKGSCVANAVCGNSKVESGESCDDGNTVAETCGDGTIQSGNYCNADCSGVISLSESCDGNDLAGESCVAQGFDGGTLTCGGSCAFDTSGCYNCSDGTVNGNEVCEVGDSQSCTVGGYVGSQDCLNDCSGWDPCVASESCGDGVVNGNEVCDDGNSINTDACLNTCVAASCGDGNVWSGVEGCDDGNSDNTDACLNTCVAASCGDGNVWSGVEECDDGNNNDNDACLSDCTNATCGDGFIYAGVETCVNCIRDAGVCNDYGVLPTISIKGGGKINFGSNNIIVTTSEATGCSVTFSKLEEIGARRGKTIERNVNLIEKRISCENVNGWINGYVGELSTGDYHVVVTAINNVGASGASVSFTITASPITITSPESEIIYTDIIKPLATVNVVGGSGCSYAVNDCTQNFECNDGLDDEDLLGVLGENCFNDKKNKFSVTATINKEIKTAGIYFSYMRTMREYERLVERSSGKRMSLDKSNKITLYPSVSGGSGKNIEINSDVAKALLSMNIGKGKVSEQSYNKIIRVLANKEEIKEILGAIAETGWGLDAKLGVKPAVQMLGNGTREFDIFVSHTEGNKKYGSLEEEKHNLKVKIKNMGMSGDRWAIVTFSSDPITIELEDGECMAVDLNNDTFEDVIACYNSEDGVTVNNIVIIDEEMEPAIDEDSTIVAPITYTTENTYVTTVDTKKMEEEFLKKLARGEYSVPLEGLDIKGIEKMLIKKYSPFLIVITLFLVYVVSVISFSGRVKPVKKNKKTKKVSKVLPKKIRKTKQKKTKK